MVSRSYRMKTRLHDDDAVGGDLGESDTSITSHESSSPSDQIVPPSGAAAGDASAGGRSEEIANLPIHGSNPGQEHTTLRTTSSPAAKQQPTASESPHRSDREKRSGTRPISLPNNKQEGAGATSTPYTAHDIQLFGSSSYSKAAFAPPIVTKTTRRETFASNSFAAAASVKRKQNKSGRSLIHPSQNLSSSSGSGDEENDSMMDVFSPPPPSILRSRPKPTMHPNSMEESTSTEIITSGTFDISVEDGNPEDELAQQHHRNHSMEKTREIAQLSSNLSPPTIFTPHAAEGGRMAVSTTQRRQHHGHLVHVPKSREGEAEHHAQEESEGAEGSLEGAENPRRKLASAPAKILVSWVSPHCFLIDQKISRTIFTS